MVTSNELDTLFNLNKKKVVLKSIVEGDNNIIEMLMPWFITQIPSWRRIYIYYLHLHHGSTKEWNSLHQIPSLQYIAEVINIITKLKEKFHARNCLKYQVWKE